MTNEELLKIAYTRELTDERVAIASAYWLDASPHEQTSADGVILARYARHAMKLLAEKDAAINALTLQLEQERKAWQASKWGYVQVTAINHDAESYVRNLALIRWDEAVDPEDVADWQNIEIQGVADLLCASSRQIAEAAYLTLNPYMEKREEGAGEGNE